MQTGGSTALWNEPSTRAHSSVSTCSWATFCSQLTPIPFFVWSTVGLALDEN